jgi:hypothetical protein
MTHKLPRTLREACHCHQFWGLTANRNGSALDKPEDDFVKQYEDYRNSCPNKGKTTHASFCERCDNSYPVEEGGADWLRQKGTTVRTPYEKFPEAIKQREGPKVRPILSESLLSFIYQRVPLAPKEHRAKIKELTELTAQEKHSMADTEATRALFRELLGMTGGANASGRGTLHIPDDIMDSLSGDAAQDNLAREHLIMEMRRQEDVGQGPRFVSLDLMEMEANHVDEFLKNARKKIIKRSKATRKGCCSRIGGVLDQMLGTTGGEYADEQGIRDRGQDDPTGDADEIAEDANLFTFIAEEFSHYEHSNDCVFADPDYSIYESGPLGEQAKLVRQGTRRPGLLREHFRLTEGAGISMEKAKSAYNMLKQKEKAGGLSSKEKTILGRLQQYMKMDKGGDEKQEEDISVEPSKTATALSSFMEASVNCYKKADAGGGKGSPDKLQYDHPAGQLTTKTRPDNAEYPTALSAVKGGGNAGKTSGKPQSLSTRGKDRGDPIGEDALDENLSPDHIAVYKFRKEAPEARAARIDHYKKTGEVMESEEAPQVSETANALANFMEASGQYAAAKARLALRSNPAGDLKTKDRPKQRLGRPLESARKARGKAAGEPRWKKGADPIGGADESKAGGRRYR